MKETFVIRGEYITLGQLLKELSVISSGGQAKWYLAEHDVFIDGQLEKRRGKKIQAGQVVDIPPHGTFAILPENISS